MSRSTFGSQSLPERPHLGVLKKLAKARLLSLRQTDPAARLCDAQLAVAREYGYPSWRKLRTHVIAQQAAGDRPAKVFTLTLVSMPLVPGNKAANLASMSKVLSEARHADLFLFPEINIAGGFWREGDATYRQIAEPIPEGLSCRAVAEMARQYKTHICAGLFESAADGCYITHFLCGPNGFVGRQRKLFANNARSGPRFLAGDEPLGVFRIRGHRLCILASADWLFPETLAAASLTETALVLAPCDGFRVGSQRNLDRLIRARAMDLDAHVAAAFGHDPEATGLILASMVAAPSGRLIATRTRAAPAMRLTTIRLPLTSPTHRWGHPRDRMAIIPPPTP